jgi:glycine/D-amino acid oxidase-like deaminating enzyme
VQSAFGTVVVIVCGVGVIGAIAALLLNRRTWDEYGRNQLIRDSETPARPSASGAVALGERDEEIRQMLEARNARRRRRGEPEIDVEQELSRLTTPAVDDELRAEIRDLVIARNHRRARQGKPPLDVEAEIEREIARLGEL